MFSPEELIEWTFEQHRPTIVTTSFGNHSAVLLDMVHRINPNAQIIWVDTQFNTPTTIAFKDLIVNRLTLNVRRYVGTPWRSYIPLVDTPDHDAFVEQVKLEPFRRVVAELKPEFWITGIRREQTDHRKGLKQIDQVNGLTKISPLLEWRERNMADYLATYHLPNEARYFDPTKVVEGRECGLHTHDFRFATT